MQVYCNFCAKKLDTTIREPLGKFHVGKVICPQCHKTDKRYLSKFDLYLYFTLSSIIYTISLQAVMFASDYLFTAYWVYALLLSVFVFFLALYLVTTLAKYIYIRAPFKTAWSDFDFRQDKTAISREINWQYIIFICVSIVTGTQTEWLILYCLLMVALILANCIRTYYAFKDELAAVPKNLLKQKN